MNPINKSNIALVILAALILLGSGAALGIGITSKKVRTDMSTLKCEGAR